MAGSKLQKAVFILLFLFLFFASLHYAKPFLVPLTIAGLLSMLLLPVAKKLENKGVNKVLAVLCSVLILVVFLGGVIALLSWQVSNMAKDAPQIEKNITQQLTQLKTFVASTFGISPAEQQKMLQKQQSYSGQMSSNFSMVLSTIFGLLTDTLLVLIYMFLFLYFRTHLKNFVVKLVPQTQKAKTLKTVEECRTVAQKYITGLALMIATLWVMYSIGYSIAGVKNAFFFAILCGLLEIVPFVGNLTGVALTIIASIAQGGSTNIILGIIITYGIVQFIQTYILEPMVVGSEVNINPLFTIVGIILGEFVWGVPGMILAIPVLGITKIICDNVESLKPYGYLLGEDKKDSSSFIDKIKERFGKKK